MSVPEIRKLLESGALTNQAAVLLYLSTWRHEEGGRVWGGFPRASMASELGIPERSVSTAVEALVSKGAIRHMRGGRGHRASDYWLCYADAACAAGSRANQAGADGSCTKQVGAAESRTSETGGAARYSPQGSESTAGGCTPYKNGEKPLKGFSQSDDKRAEAETVTLRSNEGAAEFERRFMDGEL